MFSFIVTVFIFSQLLHFVSTGSYQSSLEDVSDGGQLDDHLGPHRVKYHRYTQMFPMYEEPVTKYSNKPHVHKAKPKIPYKRLRESKHKKAQLREEDGSSRKIIRKILKLNYYKKWISPTAGYAPAGRENLHFKQWIQDHKVRDWFFQSETINWFMRPKIALIVTQDLVFTMIRKPAVTEWIIANFKKLSNPGFFDWLETVDVTQLENNPSLNIRLQRFNAAYKGNDLDNIGQLEELIVEFGAKHLLLPSNSRPPEKRLPLKHHVTFMEWLLEPAVLEWLKKENVAKFIGSPTVFAWLQKPKIMNIITNPGIFKLMLDYDEISDGLIEHYPTLSNKDTMHWLALNQPTIEEWMNTDGFSVWLLRTILDPTRFIEVLQKSRENHLNFYYISAYLTSLPGSPFETWEIEGAILDDYDGAEDAQRQNYMMGSNYDDGKPLIEISGGLEIYEKLRRRFLKEVRPRNRSSFQLVRNETVRRARKMKRSNEKSSSVLRDPNSENSGGSD